MAGGSTRMHSHASPWLAPVVQYCTKRGMPPATEADKGQRSIRNHAGPTTRVDAHQFRTPPGGGGLLLDGGRCCGALLLTPRAQSDTRDFRRALPAPQGPRGNTMQQSAGGGRDGGRGYRVICNAFVPDWEATGGGTEPRWCAWRSWEIVWRSSWRWQRSLCQTTLQQEARRECWPQRVAKDECIAHGKGSPHCLADDRRLFAVGDESAGVFKRRRWRVCTQSSETAPGTCQLRR